MHDIANFLRGHPPFDTLDAETLERVAASAEIEFHAAGTPILDSAEETSRFAYVVRRGSVELVIDGRLLDLLGEGEMFGFASLLEEAPLGFVARAAEDTLVYRIPADSIRPVLERPDAVRFVARSMNKGVRLLAGHSQSPVPTPAGRRVYSGDLHRFYRMSSSMVEKILQDDAVMVQPVWRPVLIASSTAATISRPSSRMCVLYGTPWSAEICARAWISSG
jgi:signal-transduction protein with cAMP-binding, CBS, and nucleotidyltransferase domain